MHVLVVEREEGVKGEEDMLHVGDCVGRLETHKKHYSSHPNKVRGEVNEGGAELIDAKELVGDGLFGDGQVHERVSLN